MPMSDGADPHQEAALFLFDLLDAIDTASDRAKGNDAAYRQIVERIQALRRQIETISLLPDPTRLDAIEARLAALEGRP